MHERSGPTKLVSLSNEWCGFITEFVKFRNITLKWTKGKKQTNYMSENTLYVTNLASTHYSISRMLEIVE